MHTRFLDSIKSFEGFTREAKWDYAQHSNGFGTKALYPGEKISLAEAEKRFTAEIAQARQFVEKHASGWDEGTKAALTSLTFNAGTRWASSGLGEAVRNNDIADLRARFLTYTKAGGTELPGLVNRRLAEATWIGNGGATPEFASQPPVTSAPPNPEPIAVAPAEASGSPTPLATAYLAKDMLRKFGAESGTASLSAASTVLLLLLEQELSRKNVI